MCAGREEQPRGDSRLFFCANKHLESAYCCGVFLDKIAWGGDKMEKWKIADHLVIYELERNEREKRMWQTRKVGKIRRRLMAGLFCISLFAADVAAVMPVWAAENAAAAEQTQAPVESGSGETQALDDGNGEGAAENPGGDNDEDKVTNPGGEGGENQTQNPGDGKDEDNAQNPDEGKDGDDAQNPDEGKDGDDAQNPDEGKDGDDTQNPDEESAESAEPVEPEKITQQEKNVSVGETNVKMAGSDGVFYDDVLYLSARNVMAMDERLQARYRRLCDEIAAAKNSGVEIENAVFAMDADGGLHCSYSVSMRGMDVICAELADGLEEPSVPDGENGEKDILPPVTESEKADETSPDGEESESENKDDISFEENIEKLFMPEAETFEVVEPVRLTDVDLGYGGYEAGGVQVYSLLPSEDYFRDQLTDTQKAIYDAARDTLTKGTTQFSVTVQDSSGIAWDDMTRAVCALMLVYPAETDWMKNCPDRFISMGVNVVEGVEKVVVTFGKSNFYSTSLEQRAQEKVKEVGQLAVQYAVENYPNAPAYGVVKYLDQWVCENGYFANDKGGEDAFYKLVEAGEDADPALREAWYNCHTAYGILLKGYGVCEGYAKTMSRLLDAVGIPNLFIVGDVPEGGHAWNYVRMPNGNWYLLDSTFNDESGPPSHKKSTGKYLLVKNNGRHVPDGDVLNGGEKDFIFPTLADSNYDPKREPADSWERIEVTKKKALYGCGETIETDDLTVTYYGSDGSDRKLSASDGQTDGYTTNAASLSTAQPGTLDLVVTYEMDGKTLTGKVTLTVAHILSAENTTVTLSAEEYTYDGRPQMPVPTTVSYMQNAAGGAGAPVTLVEGTDYTVSYINNINAYEPHDGRGGAPAVVIKGVGNYGGSVTKTFVIKKAAAPPAETTEVIGSWCEQPNPNRTIDLKDYFKACEEYPLNHTVTVVDDPKGILIGTFEIREDVLIYGTRAAQEGDTASIKLSAVYQNYQDAELIVKITMVSRNAALISGITMPRSVPYSGAPVSYRGTAVVKAEDGRDITGQVTLDYRYSGTMADGTAYPAQDSAAGQESGTTDAPVNAGDYKLTISVSNNADYAGSITFPFTIRKADAAVQAENLFVLMQEDGGTLPVGADGVGTDGNGAYYAFAHKTTGLMNGDPLTTEPSYTVTEDEAGTKSVTAIDLSRAGEYYIHLSGADAGMNYNLTYRYGVLTVSEERVGYTVTLDGMGHCDDFRKNGIKSGALLELSESERTPTPEEQGWVFAGWYKDKSFAKGKEWNFDTDTVQSDLTLYACWLTAAAQDGNGLKLCVQEIPDQVYTGSAQKPAVTVYDSDGKTLLKSGKDYTVKYVNNTNAVALDENGLPKATGGTAKVVNPGKADEQLTDVTGHFTKDCPYVVITGKGNYTETIYRNFLILPARIDAGDKDAASAGGAQTGNARNADNTSLAAGFTLKYTDQLVVNQTKEQKPFGSMKYKKGMKAGTDFTVTLGVAHGEGAFNAGKNPLATDWKAEGTLNAGKQYTLPAIPKGYSGAFTLTVTGQGNYTGTVTQKLYVSDKQKLMKNATITLGKNQKTFVYTGKDVELTPGYYNAETKKYHKVTASGTVDAAAAENPNDMFLVKAGKNGKTGGESLVWGKDYTIDYAGTNRAAGTATMTLTGINGYVGTKSVTFKITGTAFNAKTVDVKAYDSTKTSDAQADAFRASMPYTGKAVTQNKVMLTTKVTKQNPEAKALTYGEHYTISYKNNVKKGTVTMTFTAKPTSGYSGSFKKTYKITPQSLSKEKLAIVSQNGAGQTQGGNAVKAAYSKNGAKLSFIITNEAGTALREGVDYTVKYKNNSAVTTAQTAENKKPLMTVTGKGNYAGKVEVPFAVVQEYLAGALDRGTVTVSCAQVQKKNGMKFKDFKFKLVEGKKALSAGETKDYVIDETGCTPQIIQAYADAMAAGTALPQEPVVKVTGKNGYAGGADVEIPLGKYIYADKLTSANLYVIVSEGAGQSVYTGGQVTPDVAVYYGEKSAVSAAKNDKEKDETKLTAASGKYKLKKLTGAAGESAADYTVSYGANIASGKNKGSVTVTGAGKYGGSVTVKFMIGKKPIY